MRNSGDIDKLNANSDTLFMTSIGILTLPNCLLTGVIGPLEIFAIANAQSETATFDPVELIGLTEEPAVNFTGVSMPVQTTIDDAKPDIIIIPPIFAEVESMLNNALLVQWLERRHKDGAIIATCCAGSLLLAETGLIDHKTATTHWHLVPMFKQRYPKVDLQPQMMLIDGGSYICAGGAMAWQDLALHIVARFMSAEVAAKCTKMLVMDGTRHVQTPYFMFDQQAKEHADHGVHAVQKWMQQHYHEHASIEQLAEVANLGVRTFLRRFKQATGLTPLNYLQQLRIESARHLLEVSNKTIEEITGLTGYTDASSFRRLFKEKTGLTPKQYRDRFSRLL